MTDSRPPRLISTHVAARRLGCSRQTIYRYIEEGLLPARQFRKRYCYRIPAEAVERLLARAAEENS